MPGTLTTQATSSCGGDEMGPDVGTRVKPEDRLDDRPQVSRHRCRLVVVPINSRTKLVRLERDTKYLINGRDRAHQVHLPARHAGIDHRQPSLVVNALTLSTSAWLAHGLARTQSASGAAGREDAAQLAAPPASSPDCRVCGV
jgi:hypothetical protein